MEIIFYSKSISNLSPSIQLYLFIFFYRKSLFKRHWSMIEQLTSIRWWWIVRCIIWFWWRPFLCIRRPRITWIHRWTAWTCFSRIWISICWWLDKKQNDTSNWNKIDDKRYLLLSIVELFDPLDHVVPMIDSIQSIADCSQLVHRLQMNLEERNRLLSYVIYLLGMWN